MHVISTCSLPVASLLWQPQPSVWMLTVVCRATFQLRPGESVLAPDQEDPIEHDDHWNDDAGRSLRVASDLVPMKPRADITLVGHAFAPGHAAVRSLVVRLLVGELDKSIEVLGDRSFDQDGTLHEGPPFSRMPLVYERAAGGPDTANPVGLRGQLNAYGRIAVPNLQAPGMLITTPSDYIEPVGFGPIAPSWPTRLERLGRSGADGALLDVHSGPLPEDLDPSYFNHAPRDQQVQILRDNERIVLEHLHPDHPRFVTNLPGVRPRAAVERQGVTQNVPLRCDTLWIDTDRALCTLTWRAQIPVKHPDEPGRVVISVDNPGQSGIRMPSSRLQRPVEDASDTLVPATRTPKPTESRVLPFSPAPEPSTESRVLPFSPAPEQRRPSEKGAATGAGLPFIESPVKAPPGPPPPRPSSQIPAAPKPALPLPPLPRPSQPVIGITYSPDAGRMVSPPPPPAVVAPQDTSSPPPPPPVRVQQDRGNSPWSVPEPTGATGAPMTVGQLAALPAGQPEPAAPEAAPAVSEPVRATSKLELGKALHLIWYDAEILPKVRRKPAWKPLLAAIDGRPIDHDLDDPSTARDPMMVEDRRDIFEVLARGDAVDEPALNEAVDRAVRDDGKYVSPFLLVAGEVRFPFDEMATLKATLSIVTPFATGDEPLKMTIADAREFLRTPDLLSPPGVIEGFTSRVQDAFRKMRRAVPPGYLEDQTERVLVEKRLYQRRDVFGGIHLRAQLYLAPNSKPWPLYVPEAIATKLPMFARFSARILADALLQEDQYETHPSSLRAWAIGRVAASSKADRAAKAPQG